jgi:hypothetical protein
MEKHWNVFTSEYEVRVLKRYAGISRKLAIIYSGELVARIFYKNRSLSGLTQPAAVYPFPINNFDRVARRRQCLGRVLSIAPFKWNFIAIVVLQVMVSHSTTLETPQLGGPAAFLNLVL